MKNVYIVAGGPGDPELITVKGKKIIENADIIFTSFRFFPDKMFQGTKEGCIIYDNFKFSYGEKMVMIKEAVREGKIVAFVNMGDPCLYGMVQGLSDRLEKAMIDYEIVPGVSAFNASTAIMKRGMTGLGISNTAICTTCKDTSDIEGHLEKIASLQASVALFMSVEKISGVCKAFKNHYPPETPVVVISKASWPEQKIVQGDLHTIEDCLKKEKVQDGLILIGEFINKEYDYELERQFMERKKLSLDVPTCQ